MHADDFKLIHGIGPGIERRLHEAGVTTFGQLAALTPAELAALVGRRTGLSASRIAQQNWIGQARELAADARDWVGAGAEPSWESSQHYATFILKLLLDEDDGVRRTGVVHVHSGLEDTWAGWQDARLREFIAPHAVLPPAKAATIPAADAPGGASAAPDEPDELSTLFDLLAQPAAGTGDPARPTGLKVVTEPPAIAGTLRMEAMHALATGTAAPSHLLPSGQPFEVQFVLDLRGVKAPAASRLGYEAAVWARSLDGRVRRQVGQAAGLTDLADSLTIVVPGSPLPGNIYRLEVVASLALPQRGPAMTAVLEGVLLQVL